MGKNTMMRRSIRLYCERTGNDQWLTLLDHMVGNVGIIFTKGDLNEVRPAAAGCMACIALPACWGAGQGRAAAASGRRGGGDAGACSCHTVARTCAAPRSIPHAPAAAAASSSHPPSSPSSSSSSPSLQVRKVISEFKVGAPARVGLVAPNDVTIPGGNTGMDPSQTSFFQVGARRGGAGRELPLPAWPACLPACLGAEWRAGQPASPATTGGCSSAAGLAAAPTHTPAAGLTRLQNKPPTPPAGAQHPH